MNQNTLVCTAGVDHTIKVWSAGRDWSGTGREFKCIQTIPLNTKFCLSLKLHQSQLYTHIFLAFSCDDAKIIVMAQLDDDSNECIFEKKAILTGHEEWVQGLDFVDFESYILLASCSEDTFVRLWKIQDSPPALPENKLFFELERDDRKFKLGSYGHEIQMSLSLESVLQGHDGWVSSVHWNKSDSQLKLLSSSADKTMIIWTPGEDGIWKELIRTGDVGGNTFGFFGGKFSPDGRTILAHGYYGSLHCWIKDKNNELWSPGITIGGHFAEVQGISWEPEGKFLISVSHDQTTRIHAPWVRNGTENSWHEIARPQIHGYDLHCITSLSRYRFASGAEEKIIRIFDAPQNFVDNFHELCQIKEEKVDAHPLGASRPTLGLSNRAVNESMKVKELRNGEYPDSYFIETKLNKPPEEEVLLQNTLWPETQKLYGHDGYEVFSLAATSNGKYLASACKASSSEHAQVYIWDCNKWIVLQKLTSHQLTVTQMEFSPNDQYLLTVSRDRRWTVFEDKNLGQYPPEFVVKASTDKTNGIHTRIIWSGSWSHDTTRFATGSREGKVVIWKLEDSKVGDPLNGIVAEAKIEVKVDVTAVAFHRNHYPKNSEAYLLALGLGNGDILLYKVNGHETTEVSSIRAHHLTVKKLSFRPNADQVQLASCSDDYSVKIHNVSL